MTTLYDELLLASDNIYNAINKVAIASEERQMELAREFFTTHAIKIFEEHAKEYSHTELVANGHATFLDAGKRIIERSLEVENDLAGTRFTRVSKWDILGTPKTKQSYDYLKEQEILDPDSFFSSSVIIPEKFRRLYKNVFTSPAKSLSLVPGVLGAGAVCSIALSKIFGFDVRNSLYFGMMVAPILFVGVTLPIGIFCQNSVEKLSLERQKFEEALKYLDGNARAIYPLEQDSPLEVAVA